MKSDALSTAMLAGLATPLLQSMHEQIAAELTRRRDATAVAVTAVSLETRHEKPGVVSIVVRLQVDGQWHDVILTPYADDGVIGHTVYPLGIRAAIANGHPHA